jgi:hypothetical protein
MVLPIWLWLVLFVIAIVVGGIAWLRRTLITDPASARAVASGKVIADASVESHIRSSVMSHELTAPGETTFVAFLAPLEFTIGSDRVRTPISVALSERTLGISYKKGSLGNRVAVLISRNDIKAAQASDGPRGFSCTIETSRAQARSLGFLLQSEEDRRQLASWATQNPA